MRTSVLRIALLLSSGTWSAVAAQVPPGPTSAKFQEVARLAQDGYGDSARATIARILARTAPTDPSFPEALFTAAVVARTGDDMRQGFIRVTLDYGQSAWADKALLRLAELDYGAGDADGTVQRVTELFTNYPTSPVLADAARWAARAAFDKHQLQAGCTWVARGLAKVGDDIELKNQLEFSKQNCSVGVGLEVVPQVPESLRVKPPTKDSVPPDTARHVAPPVADTGRNARPPADTIAHHTLAPAVVPKALNDTGSTKAVKTADHWRVQVAALSDSVVIHHIVGKIESAGFKAFLLPGPRGLTRIQAGPFATRAQAAAQLAKLKAAVGGAPYVTPTP